MEKLLVIQRNGDNIKSILKNLNNKNIVLANINLCSISSTEIREKLKRKDDLAQDIDKNVLTYIKKNKLYEII